MRVIRAKEDKNLSPAILAEKEIRRRKHEIESQIVNALEKGNPVELLLTHPAGLMKKGSSKFLHSDHMVEKLFIINRFNQLKARFDAGTEFQEIDAALTAEIQKGKRKRDRRVDELSDIKIRGVRSKRGENGEKFQRFARARALKDFSELNYQEWALSTGVMVEVSQADLIAEHDSNLADVMIQINQEREILGLPLLALTEA